MYLSLWLETFVFLSGPVSGFVIVGEDNTGKLDLGIFIASIVPDGPAERDGRIKPGKEQHQEIRTGNTDDSLQLYTR